MMLMFEFLTAVFEATTIFMLVSTYTSEKRRCNRCHSFIIIGTLSLLIVLSNNLLNLGLFNLFVIVFGIFSLSCLYNRQIKTNAILSILAVFILTVTEIIVTFVMSKSLAVPISSIAEINEYKYLGTIVSKLLAFLIFKILCNNRKSQSSRNMRPQYWLLFLLMFCSSVIAIFLIFKLQYESNLDNMFYISLMGGVGLLYSTFFALYMYEKLAKQAETEKKQEMFEQQIRSQSKHLEDILVAQNQIKKLRHDLNNHFILLSKYFDNKECEAGKAYISKVKDMLDLSDSSVKTGNIALDAIIDTKKNMAISKGIIFSEKIIIPEQLFVDPVDICIIFGNALDNAIEACEHVKSTDKRINLSIIYEKNMLVCKIVNTATKRTSKFLETIKENKKNHGFGIENIKTSLEKYNGIYTFEQSNEEFVLSFVIFEK